MRTSASRSKSALAGLLLALLGLIPLAAQVGPLPDPDLLEYIRREFYRAVDDEGATRRLRAWIEARLPGPYEQRPPVVQAYWASLEGLLGKHSLNPFVKIDHVRRAIVLMDGLPERYPEDLEIRFLRFSFYHQLPALFGVRGRVAGDLAVLAGQLQTRSYERVPRSVQRDMIAYILGTDEPSPEQRALLSALLTM